MLIMKGGSLTEALIKLRCACIITINLIKGEKMLVQDAPNSSPQCINQSNQAMKSLRNSLFNTLSSSMLGGVLGSTLLLVGQAYYFASNDPGAFTKFDINVTRHQEILGALGIGAALGGVLGFVTGLVINVLSSSVKEEHDATSSLNSRVIKKLEGPLVPSR